MIGVLKGLTAVAAIAITGAANAVPLAFDFSGPSGTALFRLDSNPKPDFASSFLGSDQFGFYQVAGTFGGMPGTANTISFGNGLFASLSITAPNLGFTQFVAPSLFSGPPQSPMFKTGSFTLVNPFFGNGTLKISSAAGAIPEPASWALMVVGFGIVGTGVRRRHRTVAA